MSIENTGERLLVDDSTSNSPLFLRHKIAYVYSENFIKDKIILDDGCGSGYGSWHLISSGARKVIGIDLSKEAIEFAANRYQLKNLIFQQMDVTQLAFDGNTFDILTSFQVIEHIKDVEKYLSEIKRVLKSGGVLYIDFEPNRRIRSIQKWLLCMAQTSSIKKIP